jgi:glycosyltransferase involved in cell wall biosynthesis
VAWVAEIPVPYRLGLYRRLPSEAGIDLQLLFCTATQSDRDWRLSLEGIPHRVMRGVTLPVQPGKQFFLRINFEVWRELARYRPDVVVVGGYAHVTMQLAMLWCLARGVPYLINSESHLRGRAAGMVSGSRSSASVAARMGRGLKRFYISRATAGLPAGTLAREYLVDHGGPAERMFFLPNTCDVDWFSRESSRDRTGRDRLRGELGLGEGPVMLFVGRLVPVKGVDTLLQAIRALDTDGTARCAGCAASHKAQAAHLLVVGDGRQRGELAELVKSLGLEDRVHFIGSRPWTELPRLYAAADLLVLPSLFEPWGAVVNEALACGLPVIVSDAVGCAPDLVRTGENGWIVPAGDAQALARALGEALNDVSGLARMGAVSARLAPAWGEDACVEAFGQAVAAALRVTG